MWWSLHIDSCWWNTEQRSDLSRLQVVASQAHRLCLNHNYKHHQQCSLLHPRHSGQWREPVEGREKDCHHIVKVFIRGLAGWAGISGGFFFFVERLRWIIVFFYFEKTHFYFCLVKKINSFAQKSFSCTLHVCKHVCFCRLLCVLSCIIMLAGGSSKQSKTNK